MGQDRQQLGAEVEPGRDLAFVPGSLWRQYDDVLFRAVCIATHVGTGQPLAVLAQADTGHMIALSLAAFTCSVTVKLLDETIQSRPRFRQEPAAELPVSKSAGQALVGSGM